MRLSDTIEQFIKEMLREERAEIELKRNELAEYFHCAPSQINYVLATRFTPDHGYVISSQRGGGGCIRIVQIRRTGDDQLRYLLNERIGDSIDAQAAQLLLLQLAEKKAVSTDDARLMAAAVSPQAFAAPIPESVKNALRAKVMKSMILAVAQRPPARA